MTSLRQRLREFGAGLHQEVDDAFSALSLETVEGYRRFLQAHAAALFCLEKTLEQNGVEQLLDDWPQRRRSNALRADLLELGCAPVAPPASRTTVSVGWCWGALYVLEGSRLGGQLLARRLQAAQPGAPMNYLGHATVAGLWPAFLQQLETQAQDCDERELQRGVQEAFSLFLRAAQGQSTAAA